MRIACIIVFAIIVTSCAGSDDSSTDVRWADHVVAFSTEYDTTPGDWSAYQTLGAPNVYPAYGDIEQAWTSAEQDVQREFLELGFSDHPAPVSSVAVFETYNPGFVDTIYVRNPSSGLWQVVWSGAAFDYGDSSRIFIANFPKTTFDVTAIRLAIDEVGISGWNEIDAVAISSDTIPAKYDSTGFHN